MAVRAALEKSRPVYRVGSQKWRSVYKWGFYVDAFSATCNPDNMSLQMGPLEYIEAMTREPRMMTIFRVVQNTMREEMNKKSEGGKPCRS